ncbi:alpha/beta fold hydrolase [Nocardia sp. NPDC051570]|uniref:alpha/beta fold hydrolase n=1 Tax=Nocardia sp. NPDC051570 TaxID=3364324 RepID=UPI0037BD4BB8
MTANTTRHTRCYSATAALALTTLVAGGVTGCGASGTTGTTPSTSAAASATPVPQMISTAGHRLAFYLTPGKSPAIVLDAGGGADSSYWQNLVPVLAKQTGREIVTYDRAGVGRSDEVPGPWKAQDAASDLEAGLTQLGITQPVVLVSHSLAGEIATYFVDAHPDRVGAAVLIDANLPEFFTDTETAELVAANQPQIAALEAQPSTKQNRQLLAEAADYGPAHLAYHKMSWPQSVPAIAIVSATTPFDTPDDARLWKDAQAQFADAAPDRRLVVADNSSHDIPTDRPDVVVKAIKDVIEQVH